MIKFWFLVLSALFFTASVFAASEKSNSQECEFDAQPPQSTGVAPWTATTATRLELDCNEALEVHAAFDDKAVHEAVLKYNPEGLLIDKHIALQENFYLWHFDYTTIGAISNIEFPSGFRTSYRYLPDHQSPELDFVFDAATSRLLGSSEIDRLNHLEAIQALPFPKPEAVNQSLVHLQDLLGIHLLNDFEYFPWLRVFVVNGFGGEGEASYLVQLGESNEVLSIVNRLDGQAREFVYLDGVLIRELNTEASRSNVLRSAEGFESKESLGMEMRGLRDVEKNTSPSSAFSFPLIFSVQGTAMRGNDIAGSTEGRAAQSRSKPSSKQTESPSLDSDHDGLPDRWERLYFASLARDGRGDFDGDGVSDKREFLRSSNPKLRLDGLRRKSTQSQFSAVLHHF